jgi:beta-galactosidase GanA
MRAQTSSWWAWRRPNLIGFPCEVQLVTATVPWLNHGMLNTADARTPSAALARGISSAILVIVYLSLFSLFCTSSAFGLDEAGRSALQQLPTLFSTEHTTQLHVAGRPFLALGGELGNSTASDLKALEPALQRCAAMKLNTIMLPVYWDLIEPVEGQYDFSLVQGAIDQARRLKLRLVPLWFGTWKNSMSCYAPAWVKRDPQRFTLVRRANGQTEEIISPQCAAASEADAKAFAAFMRFLRDYDANQQTVIMVQVENEIGMIPEARDHSELSEAAYGQPVPALLMESLKADKLGAEVAAVWKQAGSRSSGTWGEVFGTSPQGEEIFSAWQFSMFVEKVASAGKKEYALPMFANAALIRPNYLPGQYPSAGPLPHLLEVWRAGAPSLDMICPDIYFPNFVEWCGRYVRNGNPLFIPEMAASLRATGNLVYAISKFKAIGVGPFAIEDVSDEKARLFAGCFGVLGGMSELILKGQRDGTILGLSPQVNFDWSVHDQPQAGDLAGVRFTAKFDKPSTGDTQATTLPTLGSGRWDAPPGTPLGSAMIVQLADEEFAIVGMGVTVTFGPVDGSGKVGIDRVQEGRYTDGQWQGGRWLNGDQTHQGRHLHLPDGQWSVQRVKLYRY